MAEFDAIVQRLGQLDLTGDDGFKLLRFWDMLDKVTKKIESIFKVLGGGDELARWNAAVEPFIERLMHLCDGIKDGHRNLMKPPPNDSQIDTDPDAMYDLLVGAMQPAARASATSDELQKEQLCRISASTSLSHSAIYGFLAPALGPGSLPRYRTVLPNDTKMLKQLLSELKFDGLPASVLYLLETTHMDGRSVSTGGVVTEEGLPVVCIKVGATDEILTRLAKHVKTAFEHDNGKGTCVRLISVTKRSSANMHEHENKIYKLLCGHDVQESLARRSLVPDCDGSPWAVPSPKAPLAGGARSVENMRLINFKAWKVAYKNHCDELTRKKNAKPPEPLDSSLLKAARQLS